MSDDYPTAVVREINGQLVLDDPDALAVIQAVDRHNKSCAREACLETVKAHGDRVTHFKQRILARGFTPDEYVIVLLNVDDDCGKRLSDILMPGQDAMWQAMRNEGKVPYARGLATRDSIEKLVTGLDQEIGDKMTRMKGKTVVVVMDHGVVEAFEV